MQSLTLPAVLLGLLALACLCIILIGLRRVLRFTGEPIKKQQSIFRRTALLFVVWVCLIAALSISGVLSNFDTFPPRPMVVIFVPIALSIVLLFSKTFVQLLKATPLHWLVLFQAFRIVVEVILWLAYEQGLIPVQMTFEGRNFDIVAGLLAVAAGVAMQQRPQWARGIGWIFNLVGLALLLNIMVVSVLSLPTPMRYFTNSPDSAVVTTFPFIYLPAMLVVLAFAFHLFSMRQLALAKWPAPGQPSTSRDGSLAV